MQDEKEIKPNNVQSGTVGALAGTIIVLGLLLFGAFYIFGQRLAEQKQAAVILMNQSDEIQDIQADIDSIKYDNLENDLNQI